MTETTTASYQLKHKDWSTCLPEGNDLWAEDKLDRAVTAEGLVRLISGQRGPLTVSLEGSWGTGKTFFLTRFQEVYRQRGGEVICFNAWSDDFLEDPLLSLLGQLTSELGKNPNDHFGESLAQAIGPILAKAGFALCKSFARNTLKIDFDDLSLNDLSTKGEKLLDAFKEMTASRDELRKALTDLGNKVRAETGKPLLIIVDELDRCRPTFAVELLERIKHLFLQENIVFLLGIDRVELEKSIAAVYGDIDAQRYLNRFIDVDFPLPATPLRAFIRGLLADSQLGEVFRNDSIHLERIYNWSNVFSTIADAQRMSLREVEHALRKFALVMISQMVNLSGDGALLSAYAVALKLGDDRERYQRFLQGKCSPKEIVDVLFPHFDETDFLNMPEPITELYDCYYRLSDDKSFQAKFDAMCATLEDTEAKVLDRSLLPSLTERCSREELRKRFAWIRGRSSRREPWTSILSTIDRSMSRAPDLP